MKKEQVLFYAINENGSVDVIENINGQDKGNYHYSDMESVERDYPVNKWQYVEVE